MAWKCVSFVGLFFLVYTIKVNGSMPRLVSVSRSTNNGDSFEVHLENDSICEISSCKQYGGSLRKGDGEKCSCQCNDAKKPTFYGTKLGQRKCAKDTEVLRDTDEGKKTVFLGCF